jgi:hypothetical protein
MKKTVSVKQKRGRPAAGITPLIGFPADPITRAAIVKWGENQLDKPTLSEAVRRLVELGLRVNSRPKQTSGARGRKADALAGRQLDRLPDQTASADQQASRKRDLLKGPEEFRGARIDRVKLK